MANNVFRVQERETNDPTPGVSNTLRYWVDVRGWHVVTVSGTAEGPFFVSLPVVGTLPPYATFDEALAAGQEWRDRMELSGF